MPAIPVAPNGARSILPEEIARTLQRQGIFERGDHVYLQTPVQRFTPSQSQIEEFAFSKAVQAKAPNENIVWFKGQYVEADNPNGNGAQWNAQELAIKSLTPMLMPVTVMHDPRTAVGTIADVQMLTPEKDKVPRARIDTVLALWGHRFPEPVREAEINADQGTLMQSMECYSPWYECSACGEVFHKLPLGAEKAMWCDHLRKSNPSAGTVDWMGSSGSGQSSDASRILGDVCFTGTGLIFGTRGAKGAYSEAFLSNFEDEVASFHQTVHTSTAESDRGATDMGLVQIEQSELDTLRKERDDARADVQTHKTAAATAEAEKSAAETAAEQAEAAKTAAEAERDTAKTELNAKNEELAGVALKDKRLGELGDGFTAKLGDFTKTRLTEQAGKLSDEDWDNRLKELEETAQVKRDASKDGTSPEGGDKDKDNTLFEREEVARLGVNSDTSTAPTAPSRIEQQSVVGSLANAFKPAKAS